MCVKDAEDALSIGKLDKKCVERKLETKRTVAVRRHAIGVIVKFVGPRKLFANATPKAKAIAATNTKADAKGKAMAKATMAGVVKTAGAKANGV